jgi:hypothetical protein
LKQIRKFRRRIVLLLAAVSLFSLAFGGWTVWQDRQATLESVRVESAAYARALREHASRALDEADTIVRDSVADLQHDGGIGAASPEKVRALFMEEIGAIDLVASLGAVDRNGVVVAHTLSESGTPNLADRDYFRFHRDNAAPVSFISRPYVSRLTGKARFSLSRRVEAPGGGFDGIVVAAFDVRHFERFSGELAGPLGSRARINLLRTDGVSLVFYPHDEKASAIDWSRRPILSTHLSKSPSGTFVSEDPILEGTKRIVSYERVEGYPLVAVVSSAWEDALAGWRARARNTTVALLLLLVSAWTSTAFLLRHLTDLEASMEREKVLGGLLPICSICKKIRDDAGYWQQLESYIHTHSEAEFSHSVCPTCLEVHYGDTLRED